ncbi:hypothetical protein CW304_19480 [Bacillus sp. UFRGS-B20]|nr:hypothetical protein CW304_19480 [Bacillus sp. UFRGS-B20]
MILPVNSGTEAFLMKINNGSIWKDKQSQDIEKSISRRSTSVFEKLAPHLFRQIDQAKILRPFMKE